MEMIRISSKAVVVNQCDDFSLFFDDEEIAYSSDESEYYQTDALKDVGKAQAIVDFFIKYSAFAGAGEVIAAITNGDIEAR